MEQSPDPVSQPDAYRASLLAALGDDDLAVALASGPATLRQLIDDAGDLLRVRPEPTEWSVLECIGHIVDAELVMSTRIRWIVSEDRPEIVGYDQDLWVDALHHNEDDPQVLLDLFDGLRRCQPGPLDTHPGIGVRAAWASIGSVARRAIELTTQLVGRPRPGPHGQARRGLDAQARPPGDRRPQVPLTTSSSRGASLSTSAAVLAADHDVLDAHAVATLEVDARLDAEGVTHDERRGVALDQVRILVALQADAVAQPVEERRAVAGRHR